MNNENDGLIPDNNAGSKTDVKQELTLPTADEAKAKYQQARYKLLNITNWHEYAGKGTADFHLADSEGNLISRLAQEGDHFRINIPGPGSKTGDGFDWVQIESIVEESDNSHDTEFIAIKVRPATNPQNDNDDTAHFFEQDASSTFVVRRNGLVVAAEVHGRNEKPNTSSENLIDKARNAIVSVGAMFGFSELQWKALVKGLIT